jgi:heme-degrading monooxygenase HmoA
MITLWQTMDDLKKWRESEEYASAHREGEKYATFSRVYAFEGRPSPWPHPVRVGCDP